MRRTRPIRADKTIADPSRNREASHSSTSILQRFASCVYPLEIFSSLLTLVLEYGFAGITVYSASITCTDRRVSLLRFQAIRDTIQESHPDKKNKIYSNIEAYIAEGLGIKRFSSIFGRSSLSSNIRWVRLFINLRENAAYRARILEISLVI